MKFGHWLLLGSLSALASCKPRSFNTNSDEGAETLAWTVNSSGWTAADEQGFSDWVKKIGAARKAMQCVTVGSCLAAVPPGNLAPEAPLKDYKPDCGRLPFILRAYYAYRMRLPFAYIRYSAPEGTKDTRYSPTGNTVSGHKDQDSFPTVASFLNTAYSEYWSATYRTAASPDPKAANAFADVYPVSINTAGIKPGTIYYDVAGHVAIVVDVKPDGSILTWNGHPDQSNSLRDFTESNFPNPPSKSRKLGGFLRFRGWKAIGNAADKKAIPNPEQPGFSMEQYDAWSNQGQTFTDFWKFVRIRMGGSSKVNPVPVFTTAVADLCAKLQDRAVGVQKAVAAGVHLKAHPGLPHNIFGAEGEWENFSTPSSDMRTKMATTALYELVNKSITAIAANNTADYDFKGSAADLAKAYLAIWNQQKVKPECIAMARNSAGQPMPINLDAAVKSSYEWSFDPYHCPELRWGIVGSPTCAADAQKLDVYQKEAKLRWNTTKDPAAATTFEWGNNTSRPSSDIMLILRKYQ
jgi:hypothetical protein